MAFDCVLRDGVVAMHFTCANLFSMGNNNNPLVGERRELRGIEAERHRRKKNVEFSLEFCNCDVSHIFERSSS